MRRPKLEKYMLVAFSEAKASLAEGNHGFGAVVVRRGRLIAKAHDREESESDPASHAEINAIRLAARKLGKDLTGCMLLSTHEPCPMCAAAIVWSGIREIGYGYSIREAMAQGRRRIPLTCRALFNRMRVKVRVYAGILRSQCAILYRRDVRQEVKRLRGANTKRFERFDRELARKRVQWWRQHERTIKRAGKDPLLLAYQALMSKMGIAPETAPVRRKTADRLVFHSRNFCPTLEACLLLGLDTRKVCRYSNERATDALVRQIDPHLRFLRNYGKLRPRSKYCEEMIVLRPSAEKRRRI